MRSLIKNGKTSEYIEIKIYEELQIINSLEIFLCRKHGSSRNYEEYTPNINDLTGSINIHLLIHPRRYEILALLYVNEYLQRAQISDIMHISSGSLEYELKKLLTRKLITANYQLIENKPRKVYYMTGDGITIFEKLRSLLF